MQIIRIFYKYIPLILLTLTFLVHCADADIESGPTGFLNPDTTDPFTAKTPLSSGKEFNFDDPTILETCGPAASECSAVYFQGTIGSVDYTAIAVNDKHDANVTTRDFNLKIYKASTDPSYTIKILKGTTLHTTTSSSILISAADTPSAGLRTITFTGDITVGTITIASATDQIIAQSY